LFRLALLLSALLVLSLPLSLLSLSLLIISAPLILTLLFLSLLLLLLPALLAVMSAAFLALWWLCCLLRLIARAPTFFLPIAISAPTLCVDQDIGGEDGRDNGQQYCHLPIKNRSHKISLPCSQTDRAGSPAPGSPARQPCWGGKGAARLGLILIPPLASQVAFRVLLITKPYDSEERREDSNTFCYWK
jgi:hypothetical protein